MGENSKIAWCDNTFNLVWGCVEQSPACANCYARDFSKRLGKDLWGINKPRQVMSDSYWQQPLKWNRAAEKAGERRRVFCSSMADVFEDHPTVAEQRLRLWPLIKATPWLDWQLLTKRADRITQCLPDDFSRETYPNVWLGFTAENQEWFDKRATAIMEQGGLWAAPSVWFVSCEPLLGAIDFKHALGWIDWVIIGGESGTHHRPLNLDYARSLRDQCQVAGVKTFFKQVGGLKPTSGGDLLDGERIQQMPL